MKGQFHWKVAILLPLFPMVFLLPWPVKLVLVGGLGGVGYFHFNPPSPQLRRVVSRGVAILSILATLFYLLTAPKGDQFTLYLVAILSVMGGALAAQLIEGEVTPIFKLAPFTATLIIIILYQSLTMLFWTIGVILVYLALILHSQIGDWRRVVVEEAALLLLSSPLIVLLFLFFPRIGLQGASFGLKGGEIVQTGFSGIVRVSTGKVIRSNRPVLEVEFLNRVPTSLYFRGAVSYQYINGTWIAGPLGEPKERLIPLSSPIVYKLKQLPTGGRTIFGLNLPIEPPPKSRLTPVYTLKSFRPLYRSQLFLLDSVERYKLIPRFIPRPALLYPAPRYNPLTYQVAQKLKGITPISKRIEALNRFVASREINYTLSPPKFDGNSIADQLFFKYRRGYCVHLATAYILLARMAGLPARLVTGYRGSRGNMVKNYLLIRGRDAHAWVEVYDPKRGWVMVDPTDFSNTTQYYRQIAKEERAERGNLWLSYIRFTLEKWVLYYNFLTQSKFISRLKKDKRFRWTFFGIVGGIGLIGVGIWFWSRRKKKPPLSPADRAILRLIRELEKRGYRRQEGETLYHFFNRIPGMEEVNLLYHLIKYRNAPQLEELKRAVRKALDNLPPPISP